MANAILLFLVIWLLVFLVVLLLPVHPVRQAGEVAAPELAGWRGMRGAFRRRLRSTTIIALFVFACAYTVLSFELILPSGPDDLPLIPAAQADGTGE